MYFIYIGLGVTAVYLTVMIIKTQYKPNKPTPPASAGTGTTTPPPAPRREMSNEGCAIWLIVILLALAGAVWLGMKYIPGLQRQTQKTTPATVQPEKWVFYWDSTSKDSGPYETRIVKNDTESIWFDVYYKCNGGLEVCRFQLLNQGDRYMGSWSQDHPRDGGEIYLRKRSPNYWSGQLKDKKGKSYGCTLRK